jgi:hypothetical protein
MEHNEFWMQFQPYVEARGKIRMGKPPKTAASNVLLRRSSFT